MNLNEKYLKDKLVAYIRKSDETVNVKRIEYKNGYIHRIVIGDDDGPDSFLYPIEDDYELIQYTGTRADGKICVRDASVETTKK